MSQESAKGIRPLGDGEPVSVQSGPTPPQPADDAPVPPKRSRSFVSVSRLHHALIFRLGCRPTGDRGPNGSYWITSTRIRFLVNDPIVDRDSAAVVAGGRKLMFYSYGYAASLLYHVLWLNSGSRAVHGATGSEPERITPSAAAMGEMLALAETELREARLAAPQRSNPPRQDQQKTERPLDLTDRIFI